MRLTALALMPAAFAIMSAVVAEATPLPAPTVAISTRKRCAASRVETPSSIVAITRQRRSPLRLLVIVSSWQIDSNSESDKLVDVNPQTDSAFIEDA
jgi:hypothetical protein